MSEKENKVNKPMTIAQWQDPMYRANGGVWVTIPENDDEDHAMTEQQLTDEQRDEPIKTATINGTVIAAPDGAVAYKYADPTEDARWLYTEREVEMVAREDAGLIERVR